MRQALALAQEAFDAGEVPVGCVIVQNDVIIGRGRNRREEFHSALGHAEIEAIHQACTHLGGWRLDDATLYVTLEPCPMCAGAILNARIPTLYYGGKEEKSGCCGSVLNLFEENFGHRPKIYGGLLAEASVALLQSFFLEKRISTHGLPPLHPPEKELY